MEIDWVQWLGMALRWFHMIAGIAWIGASFYFIWLDNSLKPSKNKDDKKLGVGGELWAVHGGGFYHKKKYQVAPKHMPKDLHWFKWEAYFTWISGVLLLSLIYYYGADIFLIDQSKMDLTQTQAIVIGLGFLAGGWIFYDMLCKSPIGEDDALFGAVWFMALAVVAYALCQVFSDRGAFVHVGALIGTVMAFNVFVIIIPNQKIVVADLIAGVTPDAAYGIKAKQRSLHNNYMTLPVLLVMVASHYPVMMGHDYNWLILAGMAAISMPIRHFFNLQHKGITDYRYPVLGVVGFIFIVLMASNYQGKLSMVELTTGAATTQEARQIVQSHCVMCHSETPTHKSFSTPPAGIMFDKMSEIIQHAPRIYDQIKTGKVKTGHMMPPGNFTGMTEQEREKLAKWIKGI